MSLSVIIDGVTHHVNQVTITANNSLAPPGINPPPMTSNPIVSNNMPPMVQEQAPNQSNFNPQNMVASAGQKIMGNIQNPLAQSAFGAAKSLFSNGAAAPPPASGSGYVNPYANITKNNPAILQPFNPVKHTGGSKKRRNKGSTRTRKFRRVRKRSSKR